MSHGAGVQPSFIPLQQRRFTVALDVRGCLDEEGNKPTDGDFLEFLKNRVGADMESIEGIEFKEIVPTLFVILTSEKKTKEFMEKVKHGVAWHGMEARNVKGWRCDGSILKVRVRYAIGLEEEEIRKCLSVYGEIIDFQWCYWDPKVFGNELGKIGNGEAIVRLRRGRDFAFLPNFLRSKRVNHCSLDVDCPFCFIIIKLEHARKPRAGCCLCDDPQHFKKNCPLYTKRSGSGDDGPQGTSRAGETVDLDMRTEDVQRKVIRDAKVAAEVKTESETEADAKFEALSLADH